MTRKLAAFGVATVGALAVFLWWSARPLARQDSPGVATTLVQESRPEDRPSAAIDPAASEEPERVAASTIEPDGALDSRAPASVEATDSEAAPAEVTVEGTIVVTDQDGLEHPFESGSMSVVAWRGGRARHQSVEVTAGRWVAVVASDAALIFAEIELGGRRAVSTLEDPVALPASGFVAARARWPRETWLRVLSAETGQELHGIELVRNARWATLPIEHPGDSAQLYGGGGVGVIASGASSPIDLGKLGGGLAHFETFFARASGFAWKRIRIDLDVGGEHVLELVAGGALHVALAGSPPPDDACLRLRRTGADARGLVAELLVQGARELRIDSLAPGPCKVSVEIGGFSEPLVLGSASVEIVAGGVAEARVEVAEPPELATAPLKGLLVLDPAWGEIAPSLVVEAISASADGRSFRKRLRAQDLQPVEGSVNTWAFDAGLAPHGSYEFEVDPPYFLLSRNVDAKTTDLRLEVPPPAIAAVRVIDEDGVEVSEPLDICWNPKPPRSVDGVMLQRVSRDSATGRYEIRAASGAISVRVLGLEFTGMKAFDLGPERNEVDFVVKRSVGFVLSLRDAATMQPWDADLDVKPFEVGGEGTRSGSEPEGRGVRIAVTGPGRYRFSIPPIEGFEPIPEQEVLVPERGFVEHVVDLVRLP